MLLGYRDFGIGALAISCENCSDPGLDMPDGHKENVPLLKAPIVQVPIFSSPILFTTVVFLGISTFSNKISFLSLFFFPPENKPIALLIC